jgi:hypothetical protein
MGVVAPGACGFESPAALEAGDGPGLSAPEAGDGPGLSAPEAGIEAPPEAGTFAPGLGPDVAVVDWGLIMPGPGMGNAAPVPWVIEAAGPAEGVVANAAGEVAGPIPPGPGRDVGATVP